MILVREKYQGIGIWIYYMKTLTNIVLAKFGCWLGKNIDHIHSPIFINDDMFSLFIVL
jgi:hypothetical protein